MGRGSFKDLHKQPVEVTVDSDPYRLENGEEVRVVVHGPEFHYELSPQMAISMGIELIRCGYFEMQLERDHLRKKIVQPTDKSPEKV